MPDGGLPKRSSKRVVIIAVKDNQPKRFTSLVWAELSGSFASEPLDVYCSGPIDICVRHATHGKNLPVAHLAQPANPPQPIISADALLDARDFGELVVKRLLGKTRELACLLAATATIAFAGDGPPVPPMEVLHPVHQQRTVDATSTSSAPSQTTSQVQLPAQSQVAQVTYHQKADCVCDACTGGCDNFGCGACSSGRRSTPSSLFKGWITQGFTWNPADPPDGFNTPVTFNDFANEYQLNQIYLQLGKAFQVGRWTLNANADVLYGTDYFFVTANGLEEHSDGTPRWNSEDGPRQNGAAKYGVALPQAFVEISNPSMRGSSFKIGHFYTTLGYESVQDPMNNFYSRSYATQYAQPFTHTGALIKHWLSPRWLFVGGVTRGWDNFEDNNDELGFLGSLMIESPTGSTFSFGLHTGSEDLLGANNRTVYSLVYERPLSSSATWVIQHNLGVEQNAAIDAVGQATDASWFGVVNYLLFDTSQSTTWGLRAEWFRDEDNARVVAIPLASQVTGSDYVGVTLSRNQQIHHSTIWRLEARWDWSDVEPLAQPGVFDTFEDDNQFLLSTSLTINF